MTDADLDKLVEQLQRMAEAKQTSYGSMRVAQMAIDEIARLRASARRDAEEIERLRARLAKWEPATFAGPVGSTFEPFAQPYSHQQTSDASKTWRETSSAARAAHTREG